MPRGTASGDADFPFAEIGSIAQMVEQRTENPCVGGSNPSLSTKI